MRLLISAVLLTSVIAVIAAVFAIRPVVADAPWEDKTSLAEDTDAVRCEGALTYRASVIEAGQRSGPSRQLGSIERVPGTGNPSGLPDFEAALADAEAEIERYC